ncbi:MAG: hypothetical protein M3Y34_00635 [Actinomycetota bacterium]|nr:hypothetical protein [Actinomycetota bacterium]
MNAVAAISHVVAIVLGAFGGFWAIDAVTPELPGESVEPAVEVPVAVEPDSPDSLFQPGPLSTAIAQLEGQEGAGAEYAFLTITPTSLSVSEVEVDGGVEPSDLSTGEPMRVIELLGKERRAITPERVRQLDLVATKDGRVWLVQLRSDDPDLSPPWQYVVPYGSDRVQAGGPLPTPIAP